MDMRNSIQYMAIVLYSISCDQCQQDKTKFGTADASAATYPGAGFKSSNVQAPPERELPKGFNTRGGSSGKKETAISCSRSEIPSPVALRQASLRVQSLKKACVR